MNSVMQDVAIAFYRRMALQKRALNQVAACFLKPPQRRPVRLSFRGPAEPYRRGGSLRSRVCRRAHDRCQSVRGRDPTPHGSISSRSLSRRHHGQDERHGAVGAVTSEAVNP
jgi:hypothetical protein